jgi:rRNA-processing protein EBP2
MAKKASKKKGKPSKEAPRVTMKDIEEMSDDEGEMPPEDEWNDDARKLKEAIMGGAFDDLLKENEGDESSIEEVGSDNEDENDVHVEEQQSASTEEDDESESDQESEQSDMQEAEHPKKKSKSAAKEDLVKKDCSASESESNGLDVEEEVGQDGNDESGSDDEIEDQNDNEDIISDDEGNTTMEKKNFVSSKALHVVTNELKAAKSGWAWPETFQVVASTPLPFGIDPLDGGVDIHDDLKREVSFYDNAHEAVKEAQAKCQEHNIPFSRPDDFFAEMVKTDGTSPTDSLLLSTAIF